MAFHGIKVLKKVHICSICGKRIWNQGYSPASHIATIMAKDKICYDCAYWKNLIENPPEYIEVLGLQCLRLHPVANKKDKTLLLGGRGKMRYFKRDDESLIQSNDIWVVGVVPERFRNALPPTIREITVKAYKQLNKTKKKCKARGCMDRYHCYRYDLSVEKETGPFNTIPSKWKIGDEHCGFFININDIGIDEDSNLNSKGHETKNS